MNSNVELNIKFWVVVCISSAALFLLNAGHINQLYIYQETFLPLAESIISGNGYSDSTNQPQFYPMWGYAFMQIPGVWLAAPAIFTLLFQYLLTIAGIYYFYKLFKIKQSYYHLLLFLPFIALMSVKIPDAVVAFLLLPYIYYLKRYLEQGNRFHLVISGVLLGLAANFRSEYIFLPLAQFALMLVFMPRNEKIKSSVANLSVFGLVILMLMPWSIRSYSHIGDYRLTATNGGAVAYISLGQLSGNKWGIVPVDSTFYAIAELQGFDSPYSPEADAYFKAELKSLISSDPLEFAKKAISNTLQIFFRGVYTGEYANLFISLDRRMEINQYLQQQGAMTKQIAALFQLEPTEYLLIIAEKSLQFAFMIIFFALMMFALVHCIRKEFWKSPLNMIIISVVIYRIATIAAVQYEYRHVTSFYILLVGLMLISFSQAFFNKKSVE